MHAYFEWQHGNLILDCRVQPRASRDEFAQLMDKHLRVRITAPPVDGKANTHLIKFIARQFGVPRQNVQMLSGEQSRNKRILIQGPTKLPSLPGLTHCPD